MEDKIYATKKNKVITEAIIFAAISHEDTFRKGTELPCILHPAEVAAIAAGMANEKSVKDKIVGDVNDVIAAAALHDTLEDTPTTKEKLIALFGANIAELVATESENKRPDEAESKTWKTRKEETIAHLKNCKDIRVKTIALADKLANLRAMYRDYRNVGDELWTRFNQSDSTEHGWYYTSVLEACPELEDTAAYEEYRGLLDKNFFHMKTTV